MTTRQRQFQWLVELGKRCQGSGSAESFVPLDMTDVAVSCPDMGVILDYVQALHPVAEIQWGKQAGLFGITIRYVADEKSIA